MHHCNNSKDNVRFNLLNPKLHLHYDYKNENIFMDVGRNWWAKQKNEEELLVTDEILGIYFFSFSFFLPSL